MLFIYSTATWMEKIPYETHETKVKFTCWTSFFRLLLVNSMCEGGNVDTVHNICIKAPDDIQKHISFTSPINEPPQRPLDYSFVGVCGGIHFQTLIVDRKTRKITQILIYKNPLVEIWKLAFYWIGTQPTQNVGPTSGRQRYEGSI